MISSIFPIDHYGFVTHSIKDASGIWRGMGFVHDGPEIIDHAQKVRIQFLRGDGPRIELLSPTDKESPVFAASRRGGGFHHVCLRVASLDRFADVIDRTPFVPVQWPLEAPAFGGRKVAFAYRNGFGLVEFVEFDGAPPLAAFADFKAA